MVLFRIILIEIKKIEDKNILLIRDNEMDSLMRNGSLYFYKIVNFR